MRQHKAGRAHAYEKSQRKLRTDDHRGSTGVQEKSYLITETVDESVSAPEHNLAPEAPQQLQQLVRTVTAAEDGAVQRTIGPSLLSGPHDDEAAISLNEVAVEIFKYNIQGVEVS